MGHFAEIMWRFGRVCSGTVPVVALGAMFIAISVEIIDVLKKKRQAMEAAVLKGKEVQQEEPDTPVEAEKEVKTPQGSDTSGSAPEVEEKN
jgi:D-aminopeptidase